MIIKSITSTLTPAIQKSLLVASSSTLLLSTLPVASVFTASPSVALKPDGGCWCTEYVANRFKIGSYPDAGNWDDYTLPANGFRRIDFPQPGAVVVMERSFPGADPNYGHIGVIEKVRDTVNGPLQIDLRGANQYVGGTLFTEFGCNNVSVTSFGANVRNRTDISYWVRDPDAGKIRYVNFSAKASPIGANIRSAPSLSANPPLRKAQPYETIEFEAWTYGDVAYDYWTGKPDARWYKLKGQDAWVSSAVVDQNPPGSSPMP